MFAQNMEDNKTELSVVKTADDIELKWAPCPPFITDGCNIAVIHSDPAINNVDIPFKLPPNANIPNHWHNSAERIILIAGELEVTYEGETTRTINVGSYAYGPSKKPHAAKCISKEPCVLFIAFEEPLYAFPIVVKD